MTRLAELEDRLEAVVVRLERLERLALASYSEIREVADYAYSNVRLEVSADEVRRLSGMRKIQDGEVIAAGLSPAELAAVKLALLRVFRFQARRDVLGITSALVVAREVASEFKQAA